MYYVSRIQLCDEFRMSCERCQRAVIFSKRLNTKCPICQKDQKWKVKISKIDGGAIDTDNAGGFVTFVDLISLTLECFGATPTVFRFVRGWKVTADNGVVSEDADFVGQWLRNFNGHASVVRNASAIFI